MRAVEAANIARYHSNFRLRLRGVEEKAWLPLVGIPSGRTGAPIRNWMQPGSNPASLTFSPDGKGLLSGTGSYATDHHVHVWDVDRQGDSHLHQA